MFNLFGGSKTDSSIEQLDVKTFDDMRADADTVVLDVRTPGEFNEGYVPNAILIDINGADFASKVDELEKDKTYLVYCRSGMRSMRACSLMAGKGFDKLYNLEGGYIAWSRENA